MLEKLFIIWFLVFAFWFFYNLKESDPETAKKDFWFLFSIAFFWPLTLIFIFFILIIISNNDKGD